MIQYVGSAAITVAISMLSVASQAKEPDGPPSVWTGCGDNPVSGTTKFMVGPTAARYLTPKAKPSEGIERCTAALNALGPEAGWERHAALLRSRAKFHLAAKQHREALTDLDSIAAIERVDLPYSRSFGVSLNMLRAIAHLEAGRRDEAASHAFLAMQARPWSLRVAEFAFGISSLRTQIPSGERQRWDNLVRLDPSYVEKRAVGLARAGDWQEALVDWQNAKPAPGEIGQSFVNVPNVQVTGAPGIPTKGVNIARTAQAVITAQVAGRPDLAEMWLAKARESINTPRELTRFERDFNIAIQPSEQFAELDKWTGLIEAATLVGKGNAESAAQKLETMTRMPFSQATLALFRTVIGKLPSQSHPHLRSLLAQVEEQIQLDSNEEYVSKFDPAKLLGEVPDHEDVMLANPYQTAVKFLRANGFSVKIAKDGKTADVGFFGNKSHPFAIGEMALLRAADLTVSQGKTAFRIVSNNDFVQTSTMTMYGVEVGPTTVAGHSTRLKIEFVDSVASQGEAGIIETADVQTALTPIYVKTEKK